MEQNRILLSQDDTLLADICSDLSRFESTFTGVIKAFNQLEIGEFTADHFDQVASGKAMVIVDAYRKSLSDHLENTLVKNSTLKRIVLESSEEMIANFLQACKDFINTDTTPDPYGRHKSRSVFLSIESLSFHEGRLIISPDSKEQLTERHCRIYVETEKDHLVYSALLKLQSGLQEFRDVLFKLNFPMSVYPMDHGPGYQVEHYLTDFFECKADKKVRIKNQAVKWAIGRKN